jgi:hypothetical protein
MILQYHIILQYRRMREIRIGASLMSLDYCL